MATTKPARTDRMTPGGSAQPEADGAGQGARDRAAAAEDLNPFHIAGQQFDRAIAYLPQFKADVINFLKRPERTVSVEFPVEMNDGSVRIFKGYRVLHNKIRGPGKGGIRYHPDVT